MSRSDLEFGLDQSRRYHKSRGAFYERMNLFMNFIILISGMSVFSQAMKGLEFIYAMPVLTVGLLQLLWNPSRRAAKHEFLCREFGRLLAKLRRSAPEDEKEVNRIECKRIRLEEDEPEMFYALEAFTYNEVARLRGANKFVHLTRWQRFTMHWFRFEGKEFEQREEVPARAKMPSNDDDVVDGNSARGRAAGTQHAKAILARAGVGNPPRPDDRIEE